MKRQWNSEELQVRCREIWVVGADKYRNEDQDLPADFDAKREEYYKTLSVPREAKAFVETLQQEMIQALSSFDRALPKISDQVRLLPKKGDGFIFLHSNVRRNHRISGG